MTDPWTWERLQTALERLLVGEPTPTVVAELRAALTFLIEEYARLERLFDQKADQSELDALRELIESTVERQRTTIEALLEENDTLRARVFVQERKDPRV